MMEVTSNNYTMSEKVTEGETRSSDGLLEFTTH